MTTSSIGLSAETPHLIFHNSLLPEHQGLADTITKIFQEAAQPMVVAKLSFCKEEGWRYQEKLSAWECIHQGEELTHRVYVFSRNFHVYMTTARAGTFCQRGLRDLAIDCTQTTVWGQWAAYILRAMDIPHNGSGRNAVKQSANAPGCLDMQHASILRGLTFRIKHGMEKDCLSTQKACQIKIAELVEESLIIAQSQEKPAKKESYKESSVPSSPHGDAPYEMPFNLLLMGNHILPSRAQLEADWEKLSKEWRKETKSPHMEIYKQCAQHIHLLRGTHENRPKLDSHAMTLLSDAVVIRKRLDAFLQQNTWSNAEYAIVGIMDRWLQLVDEQVMSWAHKHTQLFFCEADDVKIKALGECLQSFGIPIELAQCVLTWHKIPTEETGSGRIAERFQALISSYQNILQAIEEQSSPINVPLDYLFPESKKTGLGALIHWLDIAHADDGCKQKVAFEQSSYCTGLDRYHSVLEEARQQTTFGREDPIEKAMWAVYILKQLQFDRSVTLAVWHAVHSPSENHTSVDSLSSEDSRQKLDVWQVEWQKYFHVITRENLKNIYNDIVPHISTIQSSDQVLGVGQLACLKTAFSLRSKFEELCGTPELDDQCLIVIGLLDSWLRLVDKHMTFLEKLLQLEMNDNDWKTIQSFLVQMGWDMSDSKRSDWDLAAPGIVQGPGLIAQRGCRVLENLIKLHGQLLTMKVPKKDIDGQQLLESLKTNSPALQCFVKHINSCLAKLQTFSHLTIKQCLDVLNKNLENTCPPSRDSFSPSCEFEDDCVIVEAPTIEALELQGDEESNESDEEKIA